MQAAAEGKVKKHQGQQQTQGRQAAAGGVQQRAAAEREGLQPSHQELTQAGPARSHAAPAADETAQQQQQPQQERQQQRQQQQQERQKERQQRGHQPQQAGAPFQKKALRGNKKDFLKQKKLRKKGRAHGEAGYPSRLLAHALSTCSTASCLAHALTLRQRPPPVQAAAAAMSWWTRSASCWRGRAAAGRSLGSKRTNPSRWAQRRGGLKPG